MLERNLKALAAVVISLCLFYPCHAGVGAGGVGEGDRGPLPLSDETAWTDPLDDMSHVYVPAGGLVGVEVSGGEARLAAGHTEGWIASEVITCPAGHRYDLVLLEAITPGDSQILVTMANASKETSEVGFVNETVPNHVKVNATDHPVYDISPTAYPALRIQVNLKASGTDRPRLLAWSLFFVPVDEWRDDILGTSKMEDPRGLNVTGGRAELDLTGSGGPGDYAAFPTVATAGSNYDASVFYPNAGRTGYQDATALSTSSNSGVDVADIDGDGYYDLCVARSASNLVTVYWGDSSGTWSGTRALDLTAPDAYRVAAGDLDGNGRADLAIAAYSSQGAASSRVYLNKGSRSFGDQADVTFTNLEWSRVRTGDLNSDGYDDILFCHWEDANARCFFGGPSGPDTTEDISFPIVTGAFDSWIDDLDGDGHLDLIVGAKISGKMPVYMGGPNGPDTTPDYRLTIPGTYVNSISSGDINADGRVDILVYDGSGTFTLHIFEGTAQGWSDGDVHAVITGEHGFGLCAVDVNKDGYDDIALSTVDGSHRRLRIYYGGSSWPTTASISKDDSGTSDIAFATPKGASGLYRGTFTTPPIRKGADKIWDLLHLRGDTPENTSISVSVLDSSGDAITDYKDLEVMDVDLGGLDPSLNPIRVKVEMTSESNNTTPTLDMLLIKWMDLRTWREEFYGTAKIDRLVNAEVSSGALVDARVWYSEGPQQILFTSTRGNGGYTTHPVLHTLSEGVGTVSFDVVGTSAADAGHVDQDRYVDVVFSVHRTKDGFRASSPLFLGHSTGFWPQPDFEFPTVGASDVILEDINRDGHQDVVFAQETDGTTYAVNSTLFWGNEDGWNATPDLEFSTVGASGLVATDIDGDGDTDLAFSCWRDDSTTSVDSLVFLQKAGTFTGASPDHRLPTHGARGVNAGDIDDDGRTDLVFANSFNSGSVETESYVYWGRVGGGFETTPTGLPTVGAEDVRLVRWKEDNTPLDIVFANRMDNLEHYSVDSYIYLTDGSRAFNATPDVRLPTVGAVAIGSFQISDVDHKEAVVFACQCNETSYSVPSLVYYPYRPDTPTILHTEGASGVLANWIMPECGAYVSRPIAPANWQEVGSFHTFRYTATLRNGAEGAVSLIDATTWEVLAETPIGSGTNEWVVDGLFNLREHPSVRIVVMCDPVYGTDSLHLDDLWLNWTQRVKLPPSVVDISVSEPSVLRLQTVTLRIEVADEYDTPGDLTLSLEHRLNGTDTWGMYLLGTPTYSQSEGAWLYSITPKTGDAVGLYDFRVIVQDTDSMYSEPILFSGLLEVLNNLPTTPVVRIDPHTPPSTSTLNVEIVIVATDLEQPAVIYHYRWFRDGVLVENLTGDSVSSFYTKRGENWSVEVRAFDGDDEGLPALAWVLIGNAPPMVRTDLPDPEFDEDTTDDNWLNLTNAFEDPDGDHLTWSLASQPENLTVTIDPSTGKVTLTPNLDWFGQENLTFVATDGEGSASQRVTVTVLSVNDIPWIESVDGKLVMGETIEYTILQGDELVITYTLGDVEGDELVASVTSMAVTHDEAAGTIRFAPQNDEVGTLTFTLRVNDVVSPGTKVTLDFVVVVENKNDRMGEPRITKPASGSTYKVTQNITFNAFCDDPDLQYGQVLNITWSSNISGVLGYGPSLSVRITDPGTHLITLTVRDPDFDDTDTITLVIVSEGGGPPTPPPDDGDEGEGFNWALVAGIVVVVLVILVAVMFVVVGGRRKEAAHDAEMDALERADVEREVAKRARVEEREVARATMAVGAKADAAGWEAEAEGVEPPSIEGASLSQLSIEARVTEGPSEDVAKLWSGISATDAGRSDEDKEALRLENLKRKYQNAIGRLPYGIPSKELQGMDWVVLANALATGERKQVGGGKEVTLINGRWYYSDHEDTGTFLKEHGARPKEAPKRAAAPATDREVLLAKLEERFILGEISETAYEELKRKYG